MKPNPLLLVSTSLDCSLRLVKGASESVRTLERTHKHSMAKRLKGEGSVYRRKDGRWVASITLENGQRKTVYCKSKQEANKERLRLFQAMERGLQVDLTDQTVDEFFKDWLDGIEINVRARTYLRYREFITLHILPSLGKLKLQKLRPQHLQRLYKKKHTEGLAPGTIRNIHRLIHHALHDALRWGLVVVNVSDAVDPPRVVKQEMRALTAEQAEQFLLQAEGDPLEALYILALTSGMRQGELLGLKWDDIDFHRRRLKVQRTIARVPHKGFVVSETKTARSRRNIPLTVRAVEALKRHRLRQHESRLAAGLAWEEQGWVFGNQVGRPVEASSLIMRSFRPLLAKADLPLIRFHDLRHTVASLLLLAGVHPEVVADLLGHSTISLTLDTYSHVLPSMLCWSRQ